MGRKKVKIPSNNYCVICGRYTNDKKFPSENWTNQFFVCNKCKKVWCGTCMGQVNGYGPSKTFKLGKKGRINCPDCGQFAAMVKLPANLPFTQTKTQESSSFSSEGAIDKNYCKFCGENTPENATYCHVCGAKQTD